LSVLLAEVGYQVDAVDFSRRMVELARLKAGGLAGLEFFEADVYTPPLPEGSYDVVLCRHVLWAMPDPALALERWVRLLAPSGRLILVEGSWSNGAGLSAETTVELVEAAGRHASLTRLTAARYWGREITDDRYVVTSVR